MSELLVWALLTVVLLSNLWWWRRTRTVREALATSHARDERLVSDPSDTTEGDATLARAAARADCRPSELPDRVETLRERIRESKNETDRLRRLWPQSWWDAVQREPVDMDDAHVVSVRLADARTTDAQAFGDYAQNHENEIAIVVAGGDGTVVVSVGRHLREEYDASELVDEITDYAGGDGGGSAAFATGGGCDVDRLAEVVATTTARIRNELDAG